MYEDFLPERLAKLRTQKGISARDMFLSLGQANNYINNIENKKALPSMQAFFYICEYLDVTPQEFFDEGNAHPEALQAFIAEAKKLDSQSLEYILGIMKKLHFVLYPMIFRICPVSILVIIQEKFRNLLYGLKLGKWISS